MPFARDPSGPAGRLAPVRIESTSALVAERIREGIFQGAIPPGSQLNELELARSLQVSRGPIREAFQRLIHEGLLRAERNRGVFVVGLDTDSARDVYFVRQVIETAAALQLAKRKDVTALGQLERILGEMETAVGAGEWSDLVAIDLQFHRCLVAGAGSPRLIRAFEPMYSETRLLLTYLESHYERRADVLDEHQAILAAVSSGNDHELIERLVREHMTDSLAKLTADEERPPRRASRR
jgi:DNA-binding GntR family transcriptional regulator